MNTAPSRDIKPRRSHEANEWGQRICSLIVHLLKRGGEPQHRRIYLSKGRKRPPRSSAVDVLCNDMRKDDSKLNTTIFSPTSLYQPTLTIRVTLTPINIVNTVILGGFNRTHNNSKT